VLACLIRTRIAPCFMIAQLEAELAAHLHHHEKFHSTETSVSSRRQSGRTRDDRYAVQAVSVAWFPLLLRCDALFIGSRMQRVPTDLEVFGLECPSLILDRRRGAGVSARIFPSWGVILRGQFTSSQNREATESTPIVPQFARTYNRSGASFSVSSSKRYLSGGSTVAVTNRTSVCRYAVGGAHHGLIALGGTAAAAMRGSTCRCRVTVAEVDFDAPPQNGDVWWWAAGRLPSSAGCAIGLFSSKVHFLSRYDMLDKVHSKPTW
jgi:hypothetical protein